MYMICICLHSCFVDAILVVFADLFRKKANNEKSEILLRANFAGVRHARMNKPIKAEYSNF